MRAWPIAFALAGCGPDPGPARTYECGGTVDCSVVRADDPGLEVGAGDPYAPSVEPLAPDAELLLESGPQGGYHVYVNLRARGICPTRVRLERRLRLADDPLVQRTQRSQVRLVEGDDGTWVLGRAPQTFVCPPTYSGHVMFGVPLEVDVTLTEDDTCVGEGETPRSASGTARFVARCPQGDAVCLEDDEVGCDAWAGG